MKPLWMISFQSYNETCQRNQGRPMHKEKRQNELPNECSRQFEIMAASLLKGKEMKR